MGKLLQFVSAHKEGLALLGLAFIATMPEHPPKLRTLFAWFYGWLHDGLKTCVNMRSPRPPEHKPPSGQ